MLLYYSTDYVRAKHDFDTTRKSQWIADSLETNPILNVRLAVPKPATEQELNTIHDPLYVSAVKTGKPRRLAESQGFAWDECLYEAVCASTGGAVSAAIGALYQKVSGSLSSGLHHARKARGRGNCTFNGLALAACAAKQHGAKSVLILDTDAHCGGGTHSLLRTTSGVRHADIATNIYDAYLPCSGNMLRLILRAGSYLATLTQLLNRLEGADTPFDLCIYNAGMDSYEGCGTGGLRGISFDILKERERMVFSWCLRHSIPIAFVIAGGYIGPRLDKETLVALHRLTIEHAAQYKTAP
jgi:acetoin utilization deacetylase AcuC-like enzyme